MKWCGILIITLCITPFSQATTIEQVEMILISNSNLLETKDKSIGFRVLEVLQKNSVTPITIKNVVATHSRAFQMVKKQLNYCMFNLIKTPERERFLLFSQNPISIYPPIRLITLPTSSLSSPFSFKQMNGAKSLKIGTAIGRSYGLTLDEMLLNNESHIYVSRQQNSTQSLTGMLVKKRIAGFLEYTSTLKDSKNVPEPNQTIKFKALAIEGNTKPAMGYLACSPSKDGRKIIEVINKAFKLPNIRHQYIAFHRQYFGDQEARLLLDTFEQVLE